MELTVRHLVEVIKTVASPFLGSLKATMKDWDIFLPVAGLW